MCQRLLGTLVRLLSSAQNSESRQLGLRAVLCLVSATREAITDAVPGQQAGGDSAHASSGGLHADGHTGLSAPSQPDTSAYSQLFSGESITWSRDLLLAGKGADVLDLALGNAAAHHVAAGSEGHFSTVDSADGEAAEISEAGPQGHGADDGDILMLQLEVHFFLPLLSGCCCFSPCYLPTIGW